MSVIPFRKDQAITPPPDPSLDRLVTVIHDVNIAALDHVLSLCQQKVNFSYAADQASRVRKQINGHLKTLSHLPGVTL